MAPATLRRHLACLVDAGLIIRRDSPNGKRFAREAGGAIEDAFGFDLMPLVARAAEIENLAEEVRAENRAMALSREKITLTRRDIAKMIATGLEEGVPGHREGFTCATRRSPAATRAICCCDAAEFALESRRFQQRLARFRRTRAKVHSLPSHGNRPPQPEFAAMAEAAGVPGIRLEDPGDVEAGVPAALAHDGRSYAVVKRSQLAMPRGSTRRWPRASRSIW